MTITPTKCKDCLCWFQTTSYKGLCRLNSKTEETEESDCCIMGTIVALIYNNLR